MSALGYMYGAVCATGSFLPGLLAYFLRRQLGRRAAIRLAGEWIWSRGGGALRSFGSLARGLFALTAGVS